MIEVNNRVVTQYAPIIIPTLNRYQHFIQCFESLEQCVDADKTEIIIGLDYPPAEKYIDGWERISSFLTKKEEHNNFKKLTVIRHEKNCGTNGPDSNYFQLIRHVMARYDRYILIEDDNVMSRNFLQYINQGLEKYKDDPNCVAICGYNYYGVNIPEYGYNIYISKEFSAWGAGYWSHKIDNCKFFYELDFAKSLISWKNIIKIYKHEPRLLNTIMLNIASGKVFGDTMRVGYQYTSDCYSVFPTISKVRNIGFDNSGTTIFKEDDNYNKQFIDDEETFTMDNIEAKVLPETQKEIDRFFKRSFAMNALIFVRMIIYKLTGIDICLREIKKRNPALFK